MVDGTIARKTHAVTEFGSTLDSIADLVFIIAACIKVLPVVQLPGWIWCWVFVIAAMRFSKGKLLLEHTVWNKVTGFLLFLLPFTLSFLDAKYSACAICVIATIATLHDRYTKTPAR